MNHKSGLGSLVSAPPEIIGSHWGSSWLSWYCPVSWGFCRSRSEGPLYLFTCSNSPYIWWMLGWDN